MKLSQCSLSIALAICPIIFSNTASAANTQWWDDYRNQSGFVEALPHIGYSLNELQNNSEQALRDSADSRTPLYWLKRTMKMYPPATPDRYNMPVAHHETRGWDAGLYGTMGRGIFFFTRTFGEAGQRVTISAGNIPVGASCYVATGRDFANKDSMYLNQHKLTAGSDNHYTFKQSGILLLGCGDEDKQQKDTFIPLTVKGGKKSNLFILGQNTQSDWQASKATASDFGFALLYYGHANTVVPKNIALRTDEVIGKVLGDNLRTIALYEKINGMDGSGPLFHSSQGSMLINYNECCNADYRNGFVGVGFYDDRMNDKNYDGWGLWHELGHQYEPAIEYFTLFPEIQVNRYSIEACRMFYDGRDIPLSQCHENISAQDGNWDPNAVENFLNSGVDYQKYSAINDVWKQLGFFTLLRFSYGEDLFPKINQARLKAIDAAPGYSMQDKAHYVFGSEQKLIDFSVVAYSQAAGHDLRGYFTQWGMAFTAAAGQKVADMHLPQPGEESVVDKDQQMLDRLSLHFDEMNEGSKILYSTLIFSHQGPVPEKISYQWVLPAQAEVIIGTGGMKSFEIKKTNKAQTLSLKVTLTAGKATRVLTQSIIVPAKSGSRDGHNLPSAYKEGVNYRDGDIVEGRDGNIYQCKPFPNSGWCGQAASHYEPGFGIHWAEAWIRHAK